MPRSVNTADEYDFVEHNDTALSPETIVQLRQWLQPTDYLAESGEYRRHLLSQAPGTGLWICETEEYRRWHDSPDHGSLWIKGVPGAGKSVTAASLIQHLRTTENCPVLFFFFRNIVAANFSPRALIQDWLAQLLPFSAKLQFALQPRLATDLSETSDNDLIQLFLDGVSCVPKLYCVGDALDEMSTDNTPFLKKLNSLASYRPQSLKFLMTSRPKQYLQSTLRDSSIVHISLQQRLVDADILSYLKHRFELALNSQRHRDLKQDIIEMVTRKSQGLFLYAKLTMDQVEDSLLSDGPIEVATLESSLPLGLEQTYTSMLAKQRREQGITVDVQVIVLEAVTHSSRPLRLSEVSSLVRCVRPDIIEPSSSKRLIATSCGPLIEILEDETLQVIHHSFTEFLRGDTRNAAAVVASDFPIIDSVQAHKHMTFNCLQYLQSGALLLEAEKSGAVEIDASITFEPPKHLVDPHEKFYKPADNNDPFEYRQARLAHPFLNYAVENWSYHASFYDVEDEEFFQAIIEFLRPDSLSFLRWLVIQWGSTSRRKGSREGIPTPLHLAAFAGLSELASRLLHGGYSASTADAQERTPLHWAAANGHDKLAALLIKFGADPDAADGRGVKPIHLAALKNHVEVVTTLLKAGVKPNTPKTKNDHVGRFVSGEILTEGQCALLYVSRAGHTETLMAMIPYCDLQMLQQLLVKSLSADAMFEGATALFITCHVTSVKCAEALIKAGADPQKLSKWTPRTIRCGHTFSERYESAPIHWLVGSWNIENDSDSRSILKQLIKAGADIDQPNGEGRTALINAADYSRPYSDQHGVCNPAVKALIEAGANIKADTDRGWNVLHPVVKYSKDLEVIKLLVECGCDLHEKTPDGWTALMFAVDKGNRRTIDTDEATLQIVEYLLDHGADPSTKASSGNSALSLSMHLGVNIFKLLISRCDDEEEKRRCWFDLASARAHMFEQLLEVLLAEGFDMETRRDNGNTLFLDCLGGSKFKLPILRKHGAQTNVKDGCGNNAMFVLCNNATREPETLKTFCGEGVDPFETNNDGSNLLHLVSGWYTGEEEHAAILLWLVGLGIPVNATNGKGDTPLHIYQRRSYHGVGEHFLDVLNSRGEVDFQIRDSDGLSPLHLAVMRSEAEVLKLLSVGADPNFLTSDSQSILHLACRARKANIVAEILHLCEDIDIDQQDELGRTPLHYACSSGEPETVAWLLKYGASIYIKASDGSGVFHACADIGTEQCMWNIKGKRSEWLRSAIDPLRPGNTADDWRPWYRTIYRPPEVSIRRKESPGVTTILEILLQSGADVVGLDAQRALDRALFTGCASFAEVFLDNEDLFKRMTSAKSAERGDETDRLQLMQQRMRVQMQLMRPRSCLDVMRKDVASFKELLENPDTYLSLLSVDDTVQLIEECLETDPSLITTFKLVWRLTRPSICQVIDHLAVLKRVPSLVKRHSNYESTRFITEKLNLDHSWPDDISATTALGGACSQEHSNILTLKVLIEDLQVDPNVRFSVYRKDEDTSEIVPGGTALHVLTSADHFWQMKGLEYLLDNGANIDAVDENGATPLHTAAKGSVSRCHATNGLWGSLAVKTLLDHGADINMLDDSGLSALHKASASPESTRELLNRGIDATLGAKSPLFSAIFDQNVETLDILLDHGMSPDAIDETRNSNDVYYYLGTSRRVCPLLCAAYAEQDNRYIKDNVPLVRTLISREADLYLPLNEEETLIHFMFEWPAYEVTEALLQEPCVSKINFNHLEQHGRTILMAACDWRGTLPGYSTKSRRPQIPRRGQPLQILDFGVDATLVDESGKTALHHLLENPSFPNEVLLEFIDRPEVTPTLFQPDKNGHKPFHYALRTLRPAICEAFLAKGADLLEPDPQGRTALHYIASQCLLQDRNLHDSSRDYREVGKHYFEQCMKLWNKFLSQGGSINVSDHAGNTPLHTYLSMLDSRSTNEGTERCHTDHYEILFPENSEVDIFATNNLGETALHTIASRGSSTQTVKGHDKELFVLMMDKGLDPLKEDSEGRSALDVASAFDKDDIVGLMGRK
ncbi:hypothetical protein FHETE_7046 [Fusarium heterosporum]|uniref:Nephrocystin 3-like N-terminal domain-containing protein n=1 Tax=Fusarium heterosporum TaxID=42747 RepID=A0A8H5T8A1_FUSHE|nr:hypothetical protein FHETE_7046 [Fusarium heterosporum]